MQRVLFINDVGFQFGAGIAQLRQIQSFLLMGYEVAALCWNAGYTENRIPFIPLSASGKWLGMSSMPYLHIDYGISPDLIVDVVVSEASLLCPDIIIVGNIHGAKWPTNLLNGLKRLDCLVITYMHDCYWFTGRCAYTGDCNRYELGCNDECPTWQQYPPLEPHLIFDEWLLRRELFSGPQAIPIVADSHWLKEQTKRAIIAAKQVDCLYYGLDAELFKPINKSVARKLLGIPQDSFVILSGCTDVTDFRKGGHIFQEVVSNLKQDTIFLVFGNQSEQLPEVYGTGLLRDYRKMPLVFNAADIFVGTSLEEAFGQTFCEAAACAIPIVAFDVGGIPEIARHEKNARLVSDKNALSLIKEIEFFRQNPEARQQYGSRGRKIVETDFTLQAQGERWLQYLNSEETLGGKFM